MRRSLYRSLVATAVFALVALAVTGPALSGRAALGPDAFLDNNALYRTSPAPPRVFTAELTPIILDFPRDLFIARELHAGRFSLWNPLASGGAPLWAEQAGPFFPLKLPFYLAPSRTTYTLFLALRLVFAALGAYALARYRGLAPAAAIAAGAAFELAGPMVAYLPYGTCSGMSVLPWAVLGAAAIARGRRAVHATGAAVALGIAGGSGHPTQAALVYVGFGAAVLMHVLAARRQPRQMLVIAAWATLAGLLGLALAAPTLLPLAELVTLGSSYKSRWWGDFNWEYIFYQSRSALPLAVVGPGLLPFNPGYAPGLSVIGLVLAVTGVVGRRPDPALVGLALLGVSLAAPPPLIDRIYDIPGVRLILPTYAWMLLLLPLTQAVGDGVDVLPRLRRRQVVFVLLILSAVVPAVLGLSYLSAAFTPSTFGRIFLRALSGRKLVINLILPVAVALALLGGCFALQRTRFGRWSALVAVALVLAESVWRTLPYVTYQPPSNVLSGAPPPAIAFLQSGLGAGDARMLGVPHGVGFPLTGMLFNVPDARGVSAMPVQRYFDYLSAIPPGVPGWTIQAPSTARSPLLDRFAVRYVAIPRAVGVEPPQHLDGDDRMPLVYANDWVMIFENLAAEPRARVVRHAIAVNDQATAKEHVTRIAGAHAAVAVEPDARGNRPPALTGDITPADTAQIVDHSDPDRVVVDANLTAPGLVVLSDTYYPGWRATIDGAPTSIFPADLLFRAVLVPAGRHTIVFEYAPLSFRYGVWLCLSALIVCVLLILAGRSRTTTTPAVPASAA